MSKKGGEGEKDEVVGSSLYRKRELVEGSDDLDGGRKEAMPDEEKPKCCAMMSNLRIFPGDEVVSDTTSDSVPQLVYPVSNLMDFCNMFPLFLL